MLEPEKAILDVVAALGRIKAKVDTREGAEMPSN
jgi:hypothetical protein